MNARRALRLALLATCFAWAVVANAMTSLEFLRLETDGKEAGVCKELVYDFVAKGYRNVPDWSKLSVEMRKTILAKGYQTTPIEQVALEAAMALGMKK